MSLFDAAHYIDVGNALTFVESVYNDRLRVTSHVYKLNFNLGQSHVTMNMSILLLRNLFDEVIEEIRCHAPLNSWVRVFFDNFPTKEFGTSTVCVGDIDISMFMDMLLHNMQSNDAIEIDNGWQYNLVISYVLHGSCGGSVCDRSTERNVRRVCKMWFLLMVDLC